MTLPPLPIDAILPELLSSLAERPAVVLQAPAGAGKTTRVPPAILDAGLAASGQVVVLQPRRLAARAAAARIAAERGGRLGDEIGYQVRFERQASRATRILAVTDGLFVRMLADDPFLEGIGVVVFDEFHERSIQTDLALAMTRRVQLEVRPELKIVVMSATLAPEPIAAWLGDCPIVRSQGRTFPVEVRYLPHSPQGPTAPLVARGVEKLFGETGGHVLAFLPGVAEIRQTERELLHGGRVGDADLMPLYADLPLDQQQAVLEPGRRRKIVLATNVAETSLTIEGVTAVVDSGLARVLRVDPALGIDRLESTRISRASADQRCGRAGRTSPGVCLRLWSEREQAGLRDFESPEIARVDLSGPALELLCWGETDLEHFGWYEAPPASSIEQSLRLLRRLGACGQNGATELGRQMSRLPVHPRLARALIEGHTRGQGPRVALACALLSDRDPFRGGRHDESRHTSPSDILDRVAAIEAFDRSGTRHSDVGQLDAAAAKAVLRTRKQLVRLLNDMPAPAKKGTAGEPADEVVLRSLFVAFADRLARRREPNSPRAVMLGGRGVRLSRASAVRDAPLFVCVSLSETGKSESLVPLASAVERDWLPADSLQVSVDVEFDRSRERVVAVRRTRLDDLVLDEAMTSLPGDVDPAPLLAAAAAEQLERTLCLDDDATHFVTRIRFLRQWMPELELPDLGDDPLRRMLPWLAMGRQSFEELRRAPVVPALEAMLSGPQLAALQREAPERLRVPSGRMAPLRYEPGQSPILAVKIQEMFGLRETPRVAGGRVPVLLHLLAPNMRPQQVTADLASFWKNAYPIVRKELKRRYSKHPWPEDPLAARPKPTKPGG
ncbi:MAG: ATP-dependent helicase HrpB [Planctomycetia bacterium 21-64-5]|nr:MAG: ATP-dependent helicase HrpB [Planctomycetia bacterium 21-64-5]HQU42212.1 ATP-dependent helicase HrpB [Pirellulales bacterium]